MIISTILMIILSWGVLNTILTFFNVWRLRIVLSESNLFLTYNKLIYTGLDQVHSEFRCIVLLKRKPPNPF